MSAPPSPAPEPPRYVRWFLAAVLVLGFYYNSYRYPFRINSADTSPSYADTPLTLALGKYVLLLVLLLGLVLIRLVRREDWRIRNGFALAAFVYLLGFSLLVGVVTADLRYALVGIFYALSLLLLFLGRYRVPVESLNRVLVATVALALLVDFVQLLLFFTSGRLPALAYEGTIAVRFGSFLDDPNGFGLLVPWLAPFAWYYLPRGSNIVAVVLLAVALALTQSLTALGATVVAVSILAAASVLRRSSAFWQLLAFGGAAGTAAAAAVIRFRSELTEFYRLFVLSKSGSIEQHFGAVDVLRRIEFLNLLGLQPLEGTWVESGYVFLLMSFGVLYPIVYVMVGVAAMVQYHRWFTRAQDREVRAFSAGALGFLVGVYAANLNLPAVSIFPINYFTAMLVGIALCGARVEPIAARAAGSAAVTGGGAARSRRAFVPADPPA